jgi:hypothetical protein
VFLSLLVYFDRMTQRVNDMVVKSEEVRRLLLERQAQQAQSRTANGPQRSLDTDTVMQDDDSEQSDETDSDLADDDDEDEERTELRKARRKDSVSGPIIGGVPTVNSAVTSTAQATYFVVDSFNIHRLIIAGVTCASKFFSDVFYTNSRYAKVS